MCDRPGIAIGNRSIAEYIAVALLAAEGRVVTAEYSRQTGNKTKTPAQQAGCSPSLNPTRPMRHSRVPNAGYSCGRKPQDARCRRQSVWTVR